MAGCIEGSDRGQSNLFPPSLDDYVSEHNPVRAVDVFVDSLDLARLGFARAEPLGIGRPGYHAGTMLKLYIYGYLNRIPSSRRLERECQRNVELMWLIGGLAPDFKTIADFRKDNGRPIREVCRAFVALCRDLQLLTEPSVAIDGSKFKAVNARDKNFTEAKMKRRLERIDESIARYIAQLETADRQASQGGDVPEAKVTRLHEKIAKLEKEVVRLNTINEQLERSEDKQISLTDADARSMATSGKDTGIVGYNVQCAVDTKHHLIVAHEVTNVGSDRAQLANMAEQAREAMGSETLEAVADRGYYEGKEIKACADAGITVTLPKPQTSGAKAEGRFGKQDFVYHAEEDAYRCPAGKRLIYRFTGEEAGKRMRRYWTTECSTCSLKQQCTTGPERRIARWEHEAVLEQVQARLDRAPETMTLRRQTAEHPFGTIKCWMGWTHFLCTTLPKVATETSLNVLAYNTSACSPSSASTVSWRRCGPALPMPERLWRSRCSSSGAHAVGFQRIDWLVGQNLAHQRHATLAQRPRRFLTRPGPLLTVRCTAAIPAAVRITFAVR
jgi:transposase/TolA-binding protein